MAVLEYFNFLKGPNTAVSPFVMSPAMLTILSGCNISHKLGAILKDLGYVRVGAGVLETDKPIRSLYNFRQSAATQKMLATVDDSTSDDTQLFYSTGGNWTEITAAETAWANYAGINVEMETFLQYCFFVGYGATDGFLPVASLTGTSFSTSTNVTSMPQGKFIKRYRDRLYVYNTKYSGTEYPYRCYYSDTPVAGAITWTPATAFFDVDYGEEGTGLGSNWDKLILFTQYSMYLYDQTQLKQVYDTGCSNHRTIQNSGIYTFWANSDGVWASTGGQPMNISGEVIDFIRGATPSNMFGVVVDEEYHLYVGTVTVDGITYSNTMLTFNIPTKTWRWREFYSSMTVLARYNSSGAQRLWMGDSIGTVWNKSKYTDATQYYADAATTTTDGQPIAALFETAPIIITSTLKKALDTLIAYSDRAQGLRLFARVLDKNSRALTPYKSLGELKEYINNFACNVDKGEILQIQGAEVSTLPYFSFYGFALDVNDNGAIQQS